MGKERMPALGYIKIFEVLANRGGGAHPACVGRALSSRCCLSTGSPSS